MQENEREAFLRYLDDLIDVTSSGKIAWKPINPTTFVWETSSPKNARLTIQRVERTIGVVTVVVAGRPTRQEQRKVSYVFQAYNLEAAGNPLMTVETYDDKILTDKFDSLFELIKTGISENSLNFLKDILPK